MSFPERKGLFRGSFGTLMLFTVVLLTNHLFAQSTAFVYQGRLNLSGASVNGIYDLQFGLYPTNFGGSAVTGLITNAVTVADGLFTTSLDFGNVFTGSPYWLEISVRSHTNAGPFVLLTPRQNLAPAPLALYALNSGFRFTNANSFDGSLITNLIATNIVGLGSMAFLSTNTPVFNNGISVSNFAVTGTGGLNPDGSTEGINIPAGGALSWYPYYNGAQIWYNTNHSVEPELQFAAQGSASFTMGEDQTGKADVHFGGSGHYHVFFRMQSDEERMSATNPILGYSTPLGFTVNVYSNGIVNHYGAFQMQALDTNGNNILYWWDQWGQFPGYNQVQQEPVGHIAGGLTRNAVIWGGAVFTNALVRGAASALAGTLYNIDFSPTSPDFVELKLIADVTFATTNLNLLAQTRKKEVIIRAGASARHLVFPTNWIWESDTGGAVAPTSLPINGLLHLTLQASVLGATNFYAHARFASSP